MIGFERKEEATPTPLASPPPPGNEKAKRVERRKASLPWPKSEEWRKPDPGPGPGPAKH